MAEVLVTAVLAFVGTNIDDILILMMLYAQAETSRQRKNILAGQSLGMGALVLVSIAGSLGSRLLPEGCIRFLGLLPIALGVRALFDNDEDEPAQSLGVLGTAALAVSNGADNIGVYTPIFAVCSPLELLVTVGVFAVMVMLWCVLGKRLAGLPALRDIQRRFKRILVPLVLIGLGVFVLRG